MNGINGAPWVVDAPEMSRARPLLRLMIETKPPPTSTVRHSSLVVGSTKGNWITAAASVMAAFCTDRTLPLFRLTILQYVAVVIAVASVVIRTAAPPDARTGRLSVDARVTATRW